MALRDEMADTSRTGGPKRREDAMVDLPARNATVADDKRINGGLSATRGAADIPESERLG